jgi:molybdopterin-containing oxidoreductase family membrane subunit
VAKYFFAQIEGRSSKYHWAVALLSLLVFAWFIATVIRFKLGFWVTGLNHSITWGGSEVLFVLFVGLSAGSLLISALGAIFGQTEYKVLSRVAALNSVLFMSAALMMLISSWGRPDRILLPFYNINPRSMLSLNAFVYSSYITVGIIYLWAQLKNSEKWSKVLAIAAVCTAIFVHSGTGFIFGVINGREMYFSSLTPLAFVIAALSSGTALAMLVLHYSFKATGRWIDKRFYIQLSRVMLGLIFFVLFIVTIEHLIHMYAPEHYEGEHYVLFSGSFFTYVFWIQLYTIGFIIPIVILLHPRTRSRLGWILGASALHIFGILGERILFILPGQFINIPILPGFEFSSASYGDGAIINYFPMITAWVQYIGVVAAVGLAYLLLIKWLPLLPQEAKLIKPAPPADLLIEEGGEAEEEGEADTAGGAAEAEATA